LPVALKMAEDVVNFFIENGSEQPHISESFALQKACGISRDGGVPWRG
jgi:hypothetical protein